MSLSTSHQLTRLATNCYLFTCQQRKQSFELNEINPPLSSSFFRLHVAIAYWSQIILKSLPYDVLCNVTVCVQHAHHCIAADCYHFDHIEYLTSKSSHLIFLFFYKCLRYYRLNEFCFSIESNCLTLFHAPSLYLSLLPSNHLMPACLTACLSALNQIMNILIIHFFDIFFSIEFFYTGNECEEDVSSLLTLRCLVNLLACFSTSFNFNFVYALWYIKLIRESSLLFFWRFL